MKPAGERFTVAVDFDGVIHSYASPWVDAATIPDPPVDGAIAWLFQTIQKFDIAITSTRNHQPSGVQAMKAWLKKYGDGIWHEGPGYRGLEDITFPKHKPAALVYLDDRAIRFEGTFPTSREIHAARPWNKPLPAPPSPDRPPALPQAPAEASPAAGGPQDDQEGQPRQ